jgi:hypothetical protein
VECAPVTILLRAVQEDPYRIEAENIPLANKKSHRRCRSTLPARVDDVSLDLSAPFFSSTQVLQSDSDVPMARKIAPKHRQGPIRQAAALRTMPKDRHGNHALSPATSISKDEQPVQIRPKADAQVLNVDESKASKAATRSTPKNVIWSVERLPRRRRQSVHTSQMPLAHVCSSPNVPIRKPSPHVDFRVPDAAGIPTPGSAIKARTRARTPSLDFILARCSMPLPIVRDEGRALKRNGKPSSSHWP